MRLTLDRDWITIYSMSFGTIMNINKSLKSGAYVNYLSVQVLKTIRNLIWTHLNLVHNNTPYTQVRSPAQRIWRRICILILYPAQIGNERLLNSCIATGVTIQFLTVQIASTCVRKMAGIRWPLLVIT